MAKMINDYITPEQGGRTSFVAMFEEAERKRQILENDSRLKAQQKDHINPSHYQGYVKDMQWLETMQYLPHFRNPESFKAAVELQVRKYLDRSGGKDEELQETKKALWYLEFLTAYIANGNQPIRVADVQRLLKKG
jgi:hypothetical protein